MISGSPESGYFHAPAPRVQQSSRWKEDWIELEILVRIAHRKALWHVLTFVKRVVAALGPLSRLATRSTRRCTR